MDETEKTDEKEKRKAELFEKERQERLSKLDEWKVMLKSCYDFGIGRIETSRTIGSRSIKFILIVVQCPCLFL